MSSVRTKLRERGHVSVTGGWGEGRRKGEGPWVRGEEREVELGFGFWNQVLHNNWEIYRLINHIPSNVKEMRNKKSITKRI